MTSALVKGFFDDFPTIFSRHWFETSFPHDALRDVYSTPRVTFPYDIYTLTDDAGNITGTELVFALAGVEKQQIDVRIRGDVLAIDVNKSADADQKNKLVQRKGISRKSMSVEFGLRGVDRAGITSSLKNGELRIVLPKEKINETVITVD